MSSVGVTELRLWSVDVRIDRMAESPRRRSNYSRNIGVNVAAPDIVSAIQGALEEVQSRYEDIDMSKVQVYSANHKGIVNRIMD